MVLTDRGVVYADAGAKSRDVSGRGGRDGVVSGDNSFLEHMRDAVERSGVVKEETGGKDRQDAADMIDDAAKDPKTAGREALMKVISKQREEILEKLKNGDTGVKIPIGSMSLTQEEWEKLLKSFDDAQEKIREKVRAESGEELPEKRPDTTVNGDKVLVPEDTGHDIKSLRDLISESGSRPKASDDPPEAGEEENADTLERQLERLLEEK